MKLKNPEELKCELLNDLSLEIDKLIKYISNSKDVLPGVMLSVDISISLSPEGEANVDEN